MRYSELFEDMRQTIIEIDEEIEKNPELTYSGQEVSDMLKEYYNMSFDCHN